MPELYKFSGESGGKRCESTVGCDCSEVESYNHVPLKRVWKRTLVDADELAALQARLAEAEAQRAVLVVALVKALCAALATSPENYAVLRAKAALDALLTNQPGWRALIESEGI